MTCIVLQKTVSTKLGCKNGYTDAGLFTSQTLVYKTYKMHMYLTYCEDKYVDIEIASELEMSCTSGLHRSLAAVSSLVCSFKTEPEYCLTPPMHYNIKFYNTSVELKRTAPPRPSSQTVCALKFNQTVENRSVKE